MSYFLHRMRTGSPTDTLINRLIFFSLNTGFITCACSIAVLVCNRAMHDNFIYSTSSPANYTSSLASELLSSLNTRRFAPRGTTRTASTHHSTSTSSVLIPTLPAKPFAHAAPGASELSFNTLAGPEPETKVVYGIAR
ncbi:hypothetical protein OF83DRAFT_1177772 [Amylostereum chailletii]|nr:hypothetical protein OF83DRAFT_1177772 [Amylostereum chailletii]